MKIKVVIAEKDELYASKLINNLVGKYADQLEMYFFSDVDLLEQFLKEEHPDVVLAAEEFNNAAGMIQGKMAFAYLTNYKVDELEGTKAVCKYQKVEDIYKQILSLYSELGNRYVNYAEKTDGTQVVAFWGISGGVGTSTLAVAYAQHEASKGKKVLYLNLEKLASTSAFLQKDGVAAFDEVLFALKSKKMNLALKVESSVRCDDSGVFFFEPCKNFIDILDLTADDIKELLQGISEMNTYDYLVVDSDFSMDEKMNVIMEYASQIVLVSTGYAINNIKMEKYMQSVSILEERNKIAIQPKLCVVYNKFRNSESTAITIENLKNVGGIPRIENASAVDITKHVAAMGFWDTIGE